MQPVSTSLSAIYKSPIIIRETSVPYFSAPFHYHREVELVYIAEGYGKRIIGSTIQDFIAGELILIGADVPHLWISDQSFYAPGANQTSRAVVMNFDSSIFSDNFYQMEESYQVKNLLAQAQSGLSIGGNAKLLAIPQLTAMLQARSLDKVIALLQILQTIARSTDLQRIDVSGITRQPVNPGRLTSLFEYISSNLDKKITLQQAADLTNFTPPSFSRFFKQKTGKTFMDYIQETRISCASKTLLETDLTVAEISHRCGFNTVTNFNKWFKRITSLSPTEYRNSLR